MKSGSTCASSTHIDRVFPELEPSLSRIRKNVARIRSRLARIRPNLCTSFPQQRMLGDPPGRGLRPPTRAQSLPVHSKPVLWTKWPTGRVTLRIRLIVGSSERLTKSTPCAQRYNVGLAKVWGEAGKR